MQIISSEQCRLARQLLKMSPYDLAERASLDAMIVFQIENPNTLAKVDIDCVRQVYDVLCHAGVHFVGIDGVKLLHRPRS